MADDNIGQALRSQNDESRDWIKFTWTEFLKWFALISTLNITALGALHFIDKFLQFYLQLVGLVSDIFGIATAFGVMFYTISAARGLRSANEEINRLRIPPDDLKKLEATLKPVAPLRLAIWSTIAVILALFLYSCIWAFFLLRGSQS